MVGPPAAQRVKHNTVHVFITTACVKVLESGFIFRFWGPFLFHFDIFLLITRSASQEWVAMERHSPFCLLMNWLAMMKKRRTTEKSNFIRLTFNRLNQRFAGVVVVDNRDLGREVIGQIE